jgi:hypothetical protein
MQKPNVGPNTTEPDLRGLETRLRVLQKHERLEPLTSLANLAKTYRNQGRRNEAEQIEAHVKMVSMRVQKRN